MTLNLKFRHGEAISSVHPHKQLECVEPGQEFSFSFQHLLFAAPIAASSPDRGSRGRAVLQGEIWLECFLSVLDQPGTRSSVEFQTPARRFPRSKSSVRHDGRYDRSTKRLGRRSQPGRRTAFSFITPISIVIVSPPRSGAVNGCRQGYAPSRSEACRTPRCSTLEFHLHSDAGDGVLDAVHRRPRGSRPRCRAAPHTASRGSPRCRRIQQKSTSLTRKTPRRIGKRPCNSGISSLGLALWKRRTAMNRIYGRSESAVAGLGCSRSCPRSAAKQIPLHSLAGNILAPPRFAGDNLVELVDEDDAVTSRPASTAAALTLVVDRGGLLSFPGL